MDNGRQPVEDSLPTEQSILSRQESRRQRLMIVGIVLAVILILAMVVLAVIYLLQPGSPTDRIRDVFIIFMALESLVLGMVLVILIVQLARLINLLQNEIKPILNSTNETVSTLRGTTEFLSDNLVEPVIKMNGYLAGLQQALKVIGLARDKKN